MYVICGVVVNSKTCVQQLFGNSFNFEWSIASRCISLGVWDDPIVANA
jgi:hypothetical protein